LPKKTQGGHYLLNMKFKDLHGLFKDLYDSFQGTSWALKHVLVYKVTKHPCVYDVKWNYACFNV